MTLWKLIGHLQKRQQICLSIFISFLTMIIDALSLIMIYEFISTLEQQSTYVSLERINDLFGLTLPKYEVSNWAIYVGLSVILANLVRALNTKLIINITFDCERKINEIVFQRKILGSYTNFITENQFDDQKEILNEAMLVVVQGIMSVTYIFLGLFQIIGIMAGLVVTDPKSSFILFFTVSLIYIFVFSQLRKPVKAASFVRSEADTKRIGLLNEAFTNIKQIKVSRDEKLVLNDLLKYVKLYTDANAYVKWLGLIPRFIVEATVLAGIAFISAMLLRTNGSIQLPSIASIVLIAIAAGRLIPAVQKIYNAFVNIGYSADATSRIFYKVKDLVSDQNSFRSAETSVHEAFELKVTDLHYVYPGHTNPVINKINFTFTSGSLNYLVGESGSGKSTVCDLITGLLPAMSDMITFRSSEDKAILSPIIRYIPQDSSLMTGSMVFNLLGTEAPSNAKLQKARELLTAFSLAKNELDASQFLNRRVKEFGRSFSGGQRQRLSIIRGLLQEGNVLILDEPFSALDAFNSQSVLQQLETILTINILIIIITHDKSLIKNEKCFELNKTKF